MSKSPSARLRPKQHYRRRRSGKASRAAKPTDLIGEFRNARLKELEKWGIQSASPAAPQRRRSPPKPNYYVRVYGAAKQDKRTGGFVGVAVSLSCGTDGLPQWESDRVSIILQSQWIPTIVAMTLALIRAPKRRRVIILTRLQGIAEIASGYNLPHTNEQVWEDFQAAKRRHLSVAVEWQDADDSEFAELKEFADEHCANLMRKPGDPE